MNSTATLRRMSPDDYTFWQPRCERTYAEAKMKANGYSSAEAAEISRKDFEQLLPAGAASEHQHLFAAWNTAGERVGFVWFALKMSGRPRKAFIYDVIVEEKFRGQGFGRATMVAAEAEALGLGADSIGLHVFGYNQTAITLYASLGYVTTDLVMEKAIAQ